MAWLRLIRWKNLAIIFLTQLFAWALVILPMQEYNSQTLLLDTPGFLTLSLATVLIAAAGYIINDYFDIKIDIINRPDKVILEKRIPMKMAIVMHTLLNVTGLAMAAMVAHKAGHLSWIAFQVVCTLLLWFYSTHFKRQFVSGNLVVALLTAFTIVVLILYEPALHSFITESPILKRESGAMPNPVWVLGVYAYFAFMLTWMREIVKDMEDFKGDAEQGCVTMPIKLGLQKSERFSQIIGLLATIPLLNAAIKLFLSGWYFLGAYTLLALVLPLVWWMFNLSKKATQEHYNNASRQLKIIMILGIVSLIIYYFESHA